MLKITLTICLLLTLHADLPEVKVAGSMRKIMQQADFSATVRLDSLLKNKNIFALGPAENLKGEIIILNSEVFVTTIVDKRLRNHSNQKSSAAMLVYAQVPKWSSRKINEPIQSLKDLEQLLEQQAKLKNWTSPIPFQININSGKINYHVIDWQEGVAHTVANHRQFSLSGQFNNEPITLLGFYSTQHQGIITHHTSAVHLHALQINNKTCAHVDDLSLSSAFELLLPN